MQNKNFNIQTILIAPLDWGLGHATRCIPIIHSLINNGYKVIIAASEKPKILLQQEFPTVHFVELKGYKIAYSKNKWMLPFKIGMQIPKILKTIWYEHNWLQKIIQEHSINLVISDNRFGLYTSKIPCVFITHQLTIQTPFTALTNIVQQINYRYINRFTACWIPDFKDEPNLAGVLSHPKKMPFIPVYYLGLLSRFQPTETVQKKYDLCVLLSGPEPQRSILEEKILQQIGEFKGIAVVLRGLPNSDNSLTSTNNCTIHNHLKGNDLLSIVQQSEYIICRSGYTSLMELFSLQKKCIVIPTPGQTEQEFLAKKLLQQHWCLSVQQHQFNLIEVVQKAQQFNFTLPQFQQTTTNQLIPQLVESLLK